MVAQKKGTEILQSCFKVANLKMQSNLGNIGASQIEEDYKLVGNDGLFQEYLEMSGCWTIILEFTEFIPWIPF